MAASTSFMPMGGHRCLERQPARAWSPTEMTPGLRERLYRRAARQALEHFTAALGLEVASAKPFDAIAAEACSEASTLGLFQKGGIREDDFLSLRALAEVLRPREYVESGVFIGSSLYAFVGCSWVERIHAIDPDLGNLKVRDERPGRTRYIEDRDFGEVDFGQPSGDALVFFDDHVASTTRIVQAHEKGFRKLVFDDATGFHGITQRLYPAVPTVGMIALLDDLAPGDRLGWSFRDAGGQRRLGSMLGGGTTHLELRITAELLDEMQAARRLIRSIVRFPDLLETVPLRDNDPLLDRTKYLLILND